MSPIVRTNSGMNENQLQVFIDESGSPDLAGKGPNMFVVVACLMSKSETKRLAGNVGALKQDFFGRPDVVLHGHKIRRNMPPFDFGGNVRRQNDLKEAIGEVVRCCNVTIVAACIDKRRLTKCYARPYDPYGIALGFCMERVCWITERKGQNGGARILAERRDHAKDRLLRQAFLQMQQEGKYGAMSCQVKSGLWLEFLPKSADLPGLEIADLVAGPIRQLVENPRQPNRAVEIIRPKFYAPRGPLLRYGLKVFPEDETIRGDLEAWWRRGAVGRRVPEAELLVLA